MSSPRQENSSSAPTKEENLRLEKKYAADKQNNWKYNQHNKKNMEPIGEGLQAWDKDYTLLNTDKWAPYFIPQINYNKPKECPVCPNMSAGYARQYTTLKDFHPSRKVLPPDNINRNYLDKLNKGE